MDVLQLHSTKQVLMIINCKVLGSHHIDILATILFMPSSSGSYKFVQFA